MATLHPTAFRRLADRGQSAKLGGLWAACALPGEGPEYKFAAAPNPLRSALRRLIRLYREGVR